MQKVSKRGLASGKVPTSDLLAGVAGAHSRLSGQDDCPTGQTRHVLWVPESSSFPLPVVHPGQGQRDLLSPSYKVPLLRPEGRREPQFCPHHIPVHARVPNPPPGGCQGPGECWGGGIWAGALLSARRLPKGQEPEQGAGREARLGQEDL